MKTARLTQPAPPARSEEFFARTEQQQTSVRLVLGSVVFCYIWLLVVIGAIGQPVLRVLVPQMVQFFAVALLIFWSARASPGIRHWRRALAMALDYGNTAFLIGVAGATMAPVFGVLLWITVGYGIRYGRSYLLIGVALSLLGVLGIGLLSPSWTDPYLLITIALMVLLVPAYAHGLTLAMRQAHDEALRANLAKSRFLAQASHDLRQPIHAIGLFTSCLKQSGLDEDQMRMVDSIDRSLDGVSALFRSLLDVSTLDSGRIVPARQPVALGPLLRELAGQHQDAARKAGVTLRAAGGGGVLVQTDRAILAVILGNLLSNAVKYAPGRKVLIGCRRRGGQVSVLVCDQGPGIEPREQARVFDEFYRSPRHRRLREGIGLGLSIVRRMARLLGLQVALTSVPGRGTVIEVAGLEPSPETAEPAPAKATPVTALAGMRILLIEDHDEVRIATRRLLESWGCTVEDEASAHAFPRDCDLILADQDLEDGTGGECVERIRAVLGRPVPAIIMSGHDIAHVAGELPDKSVPILSKPVHPARLRAALMAQKFAARA